MVSIEKKTSIIKLDLPVAWSPATSERRLWSSVLQQNHPAIVNYVLYMSVKTFLALAVVQWKVVLALETNPVEDDAILYKFGYENESMFGEKSLVFSPS
ncbi:hypothetical protein Hanom_Chr04g00320211 [Helianthus anomalus]